MSAPVRRQRRGTYGDGGFTLLEVMIAVAILGISMTSLLTSQMASIRATRYAQAITSVAFLAEYQLIEVEWLMEKDGGWVREDRSYEGSFSEQGWPDTKFKCLVDFIELPDYSKLRAAKAALRNAELDLEFTRVRAPVQGYVTNLNLRIGTQAVANTPMIALVDVASFWVYGFFREDTIAGVLFKRLFEVAGSITQAAFLPGFPAALQPLISMHSAELPHAICQALDR